MSSLNKARTSSASLNVKRLRAAVIAIARLTFADMAADSGVLPGIIVVRASFAIRDFPQGVISAYLETSKERTELLRRLRAFPRGERGRENAAPLKIRFTRLRLRRRRASKTTPPPSSQRAPRRTSYGPPSRPAPAARFRRSC